MSTESSTATLPDGCTNALELRIYGLMRSGNHAIIEWIQNQHCGQAIAFLNNVEHGDIDPYVGFRQKEVKGLDEIPELAIEALRAAPKQLLIFSYEDRAESAEAPDFLASVFQPAFEMQRRRYLGQSAKVLDVMIMRDPFNLLASRIAMHRQRGALGGVTDNARIMADWKLLARRALALAAEPDAGQLVIAYNRWANDESYRRRLSATLHGRFNDASMGKVSDFGKGSSFKVDNLLTVGMLAQRWRKIFSLQRLRRIPHYWRRLVPAPPDMKVTERWSRFEKDPEYRAAIADPELLALSEQLFGELPGTRAYIKSLGSQMR